MYTKEFRWVSLGLPSPQLWQSARVPDVWQHRPGPKGAWESHFPSQVDSLKNQNQKQTWGLILVTLNNKDT